VSVSPSGPEWTSEKVVAPKPSMTWRGLELSTVMTTSAAASPTASTQVARTAIVMAPTFRRVMFPCIPPEPLLADEVRLPQSAGVSSTKALAQSLVYTGANDAGKAGKRQASSWGRGRAVVEETVPRGWATAAGRLTRGGVDAVCETPTAPHRCCRLNRTSPSLIRRCPNLFPRRGILAARQSPLSVCPSSLILPFALRPQTGRTTRPL
jgi:hypothetical protein